MFNIPVGPAFGVEPGIGIGPIRFGATIATVERLMDLPCPQKTETTCFYPIHALEFTFDGGALSKIEIHGHERKVNRGNPDEVYGIFNGRMLNGVEFGMYRHYVESIMGPAPKGSEVAEGSSPRGFATVYVGEYPGVRLEYDKLPNGNTVLEGIVLTKASPEELEAAAAAARARTAELAARKAEAAQGASGEPRPSPAPSQRPKAPLH